MGQICPPLPSFLLKCVLSNMFTPPNPTNGSIAHLSPLLVNPSARQPGKARTSFSFGLDEPDSSFCFSQLGRESSSFLLQHDQGNRGMAQVSPRVRPPPVTRSSTPMNVNVRKVRGRSKLGDESLTAGADGAEAGDGSWGMVDSMRLWRQDAILQHLYETAAFWGDKILSWTGERLPILLQE